MREETQNTLFWLAFVVILFGAGYWIIMAATWFCEANKALKPAEKPPAKVKLFLPARK